MLKRRAWELRYAVRQRFVMKGEIFIYIYLYMFSGLIYAQSFQSEENSSYPTPFRSPHTKVSLCLFSARTGHCEQGAACP